VAKIKNKKIKDILFLQQSVLKAVDEFMYKRRITSFITQQPEVSDVTLFCIKPGQQFIF